MSESTPRDLYDRWLAFHTAHPEVGDELATLGLEYVEGGQGHLTIVMLWEVLRWRGNIGATSEEDEYVLNDVYRAYYARWLMEEFPDELGGRFEIRRGPYWPRPVGRLG